MRTQFSSISSFYLRCILFSSEVSCGILEFGQYWYFFTVYDIFGPNLSLINPQAQGYFHCSIHCKIIVYNFKLTVRLLKYQTTNLGLLISMHFKRVLQENFSFFATKFPIQYIVTRTVIFFHAFNFVVTIFLRICKK